MALINKSFALMIPAMRISTVLVLLTICLLLSANILGFTPDESKQVLDSRKQISENLAIQFSVFEPEQDTKKMENMLGYVLKRNPNFESAGIRLNNGQLIFQAGDHEKKWAISEKTKSSSTHLLVPLLQNRHLWGNVELKFAPLPGESAFDFFQSSIFKTSSFVLVVGFFLYSAFMLRTLKMLDPSSAIPDRVESALDTLSEGVIILNEREEIFFVNKVLTEKLDRPMSSLLGKKASELQWQNSNIDLSEHDYPWQTVLKSGMNSIGAQLKLSSSQGKVYKFVINASPIYAGNSVIQGVLITLDDITELEERNTELQSMVSQLKETQAQIQQQNKELHFLANRDSLTGCLNRRSFNEQFENEFRKAQQSDLELSCIMADIDHFKAVNDNYGHATGDIVIKLLAEILLANTRKFDLVGRYGGEEFCIVLPGLTGEEAVVVAERIRLRLKDESANRFENGPLVMASLGVSSIKDKPSSFSELNNFADEALYSAKNSGRNRVMRWQPKVESENYTESNTSLVDSNIGRNNINKDSMTNLQLRVNELESMASKFTAELEYTKFHDVLTGLPNHILFYDRLSHIIERGRRYNELAAILVIDIGMFSQINTTLGRNAGDKLLVLVAERLSSIFRKSDDISRLTISRFGGDEFAILLTDLNSKEDVTWVVKRLQDSMTAPIDLEGNSIFLACHIGISLYPADANSVDEMINKAIIAKKHCKKLHTETSYQFFDHNIQGQSVNHLNLDKELRLAIENEEWELLYQPKMDIKSNSIVGAEALIRWRHPTKGLISPIEFIEFAEQRGLIVAIGDWVIQTACKQIKEWSNLGLTDFNIAVNLSAVQLRQDDFVAKVFNILSDSGISPRHLELEVTESTLMNNFKVAETALRRLNSRGINIAVDDFGTGYSSLSYLKHLPINTLKIDRVFVKDICNDENDKQIVKALINMAHSMKMKVVAEGVEEQDQLDILAQYACDEIQGYFLSKPIPAGELFEMVKKHSTYL